MRLVSVFATRGYDHLDLLHMLSGQKGCVAPNESPGPEHTVGRTCEFPISFLSRYLDPANAISNPTPVPPTQNFMLHPCCMLSAVFLATSPYFVCHFPLAIERSTAA